MAKAEKKNTKKMIIGICVILFIIGMGVGFYCGLQDKKQSASVKESDSTNLEAVGEMKDGELIDYEASGALEMPSYKGLKVTVTPTENDVYRQILLDAEDAQKSVKIENADRVLKDDWISLDYVGYIDGQESEDLNESAAIIHIGSADLFNAAFDRALMGQKVGEDISFDIAFADDYYDADVAGMTVTFSVKVNAKINDDYVKAMSKNKYQTLKAYFAYVKQKEWKENIEVAGETAWDEYMEKCKVKKYPQGSVKQALADLKRQYTSFGEMNGTSYEEVIAGLGMTEEDVKGLAKDEVKARMVAKTIATKEKLKMSDKEYEQYLLREVDPEEEADKHLQALETSYKQSTSVYPRDDMLIRYVQKYIGKYIKQE